jgi:two-component system response regulator GlrR
MRQGGGDEHDDELIAPTHGGATEGTRTAELDFAAVRRFELVIVEGPDKGRICQSASDRFSIGSHESNDLVIDDPTVSRFHCEVRIDPRGARVRDLDSKNGTVVDGVTVVEAFLRGGSVLRFGHSAVRFQFSVESNRLEVSEHTSFGPLVAVSPAMRTAFALLERAAAPNATVLLEGETGTGKEGAAESIHENSARRDKPFVVIDCSAIPENLLESELFGHERGSFTGAAGRRIGAFEEASTGTLFLDEIGELPLNLQPKLLRALEQHEIRRVGSNTHLAIDVRVVAATNRDLRGEVNAGRFRSDLYFRLAVLKVPLPPLRNRPEDIPVLVDRILASLGATADKAATLRTPEFLAGLQRAVWPGNVRELRNYLERCLVFQGPLPIDEPSSRASVPTDVDLNAPYADGRRRALDAFERRYIDGLLRLHKGKVAAAARVAGIDRVYMYQLMRRHGLRA